MAIKKEDMKKCCIYKRDATFVIVPLFPFVFLLVVKNLKNDMLRLGADSLPPPPRPSGDEVA